MMDAKVRDYPDLLKRGAGVVNTNNDDYLRAKSRIKQSKRIETLEKDVQTINSKLDLLLSLLTDKQ